MLKNKYYVTYFDKFDSRIPAVFVNNKTLEVMTALDNKGSFRIVLLELTLKTWYRIVILSLSHLGQVI